MSILVDRNTRVITQGITGKTGQFHTRACRDYANGRNCFVAGKALLAQSGLPIITASNMADAAQKVVAAARGA